MESNSMSASERWWTALIIIIAVLLSQLVLPYPVTAAVTWLGRFSSAPFLDGSGEWKFIVVDGLSLVASGFVCTAIGLSLPFYGLERMNKVHKSSIRQITVILLILLVALYSFIFGMVTVGQPVEPRKIFYIIGFATGSILSCVQMWRAN